MSAATHCRHTRKSRRNRRGLSILEVMLAIAILGVSLATMGELVSLGVRGAQGAQEVTTGSVLCENKMAELVVGIMPLSSNSGLFEENPEWAYQIEVIQIDQTGLVSVMVAGAPVDDPNAIPFRLYRWLVDPVLKYPPEEEEVTDGSEASL